MHAPIHPFFAIQTLKGAPQTPTSRIPCDVSSFRHPREAQVALTTTIRTRTAIPSTKFKKLSQPSTTSWTTQKTRSVSGQTVVQAQATHQTTPPDLPLVIQAPHHSSTYPTTLPGPQSALILQHQQDSPESPPPVLWAFSPMLDSGLVASPRCQKKHPCARRLEPSRSRVLLLQPTS